ncbi:hypothetical protein RhiirA1_462487 [Rhizophagus irregularis]|uniref:Uncharacterized protein n=1 Tax=Rhizophagus irregularis TaxID=588596 RepID=A0A2N0RM62_9GLOM|nr:hypothetical protein RhiirA1_462487 [Rhizophagus irregularis]
MTKITNIHNRSLHGHLTKAIWHVNNDALKAWEKGRVTQHTPSTDAPSIFRQGHFVPLWVIYITYNYLQAGGLFTNISRFSSSFNYQGSSLV